MVPVANVELKRYEEATKVAGSLLLLVTVWGYDPSFDVW